MDKHCPLLPPPQPRQRDRWKGGERDEGRDKARADLRIGEEEDDGLVLQACLHEAVLDVLSPLCKAVVLGELDLEAVVVRSKGEQTYTLAAVCEKGVSITTHVGCTIIWMSYNTWVWTCPSMYQKERKKERKKERMIDR